MTQCDSTGFSVTCSSCIGGNTYADPGVLEGLFSSDPLGRVDGQHLVDQVLGLWSHRVPLG